MFDALSRDAPKPSSQNFGASCKDRTTKARNQSLSLRPDLCVEVLFGNAVCAASLDTRTHAYLCSGAEEVIVVGADGAVEFRGREGVRRRSVFNVKLDLDICLLPYGRAITPLAAASQL